MVRHMVLVTFRDEVSQDEIGSVLAQLSDLRSLLPGMIAFAGGPNVSPEGLGRGFTHAFTCDFEDSAARDAYLAHPAHKTAGQRLVAAARGGLKGLLVADIELT